MAGDSEAEKELAKLDRFEVERFGLRRFVELAWHQVEPGRYLSNWHIDVVCEHLEAVHRCEIRNLLINEPPGCMKSLIVAVFFPAWVWSRDPGHKFIFSTYAQELSDRDAKRHRDLVASPWFQARWGDRCTIGSDQVQQVRNFETSAKGFRFSTSIGGIATGRHADTLVFDDPNKAQDAFVGASEATARFDRAHTYWTRAMSTRRANPETTRQVVIAQRLHDADVPGRLKDEGYELLCLPMRYEPAIVSIPLGREKDPRTVDGELLWPERFPESDVAQLERNLGPLHSAAQLQQTPAPESGALFKLDEIRYYDAVPEMRGVQVVQSWDCAFKGTADSDYVVGQVWARVGPNFFLLDQVRGQWTFTETVRQVESLSAKWPRAITKLIEDKANGPAIIDTLQLRLPGVTPVNPEGGKIARANAVSPLFRSGNVYIPSPKLADFVSDFERELVRFPRAAHDDQVDAMTQALIHLSGGVEAYGYEPARPAVRDDGPAPARMPSGLRGRPGMI